MMSCFSSPKRVAVALALAAFIAVGCNPPASKDGENSPAPKTGENTGKAPVATLGKIAFVTNNASDFWTIARKGCEKAEKELNGKYKLDFQIPAEGTAADQKRIVESLLVGGYSGMAISPVSPKDQTELLNSASAKMPVVTQDSDAPDSKRLCYVGTDNVQAGHEAGKAIKEALPKGGKIMLFVGKKDAQNAKERAQGITDELKGSNITILDIRTDDTDRVRAKANVSDTLVKTPDIACLVGLWSYNGPAILNAVKDANKVGKVQIVCFDEEDETLAGVKDGAIYATVVQQPFEFGYQSIMLLAKLADKDMSGIPADKKIIVPTKTIKKDTVEAFTTEINDMRGRSKK